MKVHRRWFAFWWDSMFGRWASYITHPDRRRALSEARGLRAQGFRARVGWETLE